MVLLELCLMDFVYLNAADNRDQTAKKVDDYLKVVREKDKGGPLSDLIQSLLSQSPQERPEIEKIQSELEQRFPEILVKQEESR